MIMPSNSKTALIISRIRIGLSVKRLAGDTARAANTDEVKELRREAKDLKEVVAEQTLELRLLKKSMTGDGGDHE